MLSSYKVLAIGGRYDHRIDEFRSRWHYPPFGKRAVGAELSVGAIAVQMRNAGILTSSSSNMGAAVGGIGGSGMVSSFVHDANAPQPSDVVVVALVKTTGGSHAAGHHHHGGRMKREVQDELCKQQLLALRKLWSGGFTAVVLYGTKSRKQVETHCERVHASFLVTFRESNYESRACCLYCFFFFPPRCLLCVGCLSGWGHLTTHHPYV